MKIALLSDLHANRQALDACLRHARQVGVDRFAFLGDLVGYGADPVAVVDTVMELASAGAIVIKGNHDAMAVRPPDEVSKVGDEGSHWTHEQLSSAQRAFLDGLPMTWREQSMLLVHASVNNPQDWNYVDSPNTAAMSLDAAAASHVEVRHVFGGHVHQQALYYRGSTGKLMQFQPVAGAAVPLPGHRHWLATVGSAGQPRDGNPRAMYAVFDPDAAQVVFHRVAYDHQAAAAAVRRAGLPEYFAKRLEDGR